MFISGKSNVLGRKGLEKLDLLFIVAESIDINCGEALLTISKELGLEETFPNRVELWKFRCHNPLRKTSRRGLLKTKDSDALIRLLCSIVERLYPVIHQLLSSNEPQSISNQRWRLFENRFKELITNRFNTRLAFVQNILNSENCNSLIRELVIILSLSSGSSGFDRLRASLLDPVTYLL